MRSQCVNDEYLPFKRKEHINSPIEMNGSFNNFDVNINILNVTLIITIIIIKTSLGQSTETQAIRQKGKLLQAVLDTKSTVTRN